MAVSRQPLDIWASRLVAVTIAVVPFHAFLTVWVSTFVGHFFLLRLWDEAALFLLLGYTAYCLVQDGDMRRRFFSSRLVRLFGLYALLMILLGLIALSRHEVVLKAFAYALVINLRFLSWMLAVWVVAKRSDWLRQHWRYVAFVPLAVVVGFGLLQFFALPHDFLKHFGYNDSTSYVAITTLNQNSSTIRIQSFLRGANPLGAFLAAMLVLLLAKLRHPLRSRKLWLLTVLTVLALFLSFSRSAWIGAALGGMLVGWYRFLRFRRLYAASIAAVIIIAAASLLFFRGSGGVQNALLHHTTKSTATVTSNQGHDSALRSSLHDLSRQPFGGGPGSAGQEGIYNTGHAARNTESYWLQIALELGWPGVVVLLAILSVLGHELWLRRRYALGLGLLCSLVGLAVVNLLSYGWTDDTLAFVWWGLAGIALAMSAKEVHEVQDNEI